MSEEPVTAPSVYASCSSYVLGRMLGQRNAEAAITAAVVQATDAPLEGGTVPAVQTLRRVAESFDTALRVDGGAVCIAKARTRHLDAALESGRDVWVTVDDDVEASVRTVRWLVEAVHDTQPSICIVPCWLRTERVVNVEWSPVYTTRALSDGGAARRATRGGFGLVAVNRAAMLAVADASPEFTDSDGMRKRAAFFERFQGGQWLGEDFAFFSRVPASVRVEALITGETSHAGQLLNLRDCDT